MIKLGINTGFALNRYPLPEQWLKIIGEELDLRYVQVTADLINPSLGKDIIDDYICDIRKYKAKYNISIVSVMTGAFTRVNHFSHPCESVRLFWISWFKELADIAVRIGAKNLASHFGILCYEDFYNEERRNYIIKETVSAWFELAEYGKKIGLESLSWEPMSIKREYGETLLSTQYIQNLLKGTAIPVSLCLDVDHGDISSNNYDDYYYKSWIERFGNNAPYIHLKQSLIDKGGHYPFTHEFNQRGTIKAEELISVVNSHGFHNTLLLLELSFREREPVDSNVLNDLKESVNYWKNALQKLENK